MKKLSALLMSILMCGCASKDYQTISASQAKEMMNLDKVVIIDVREESEYKQGHIENSVLIPLNTISENNSQLPDKDQTLLIYCRSGNRSAKAAKKFVKLGYQNVYDFGGIIDWSYGIVVDE